MKKILTISFVLSCAPFLANGSPIEAEKAYNPNVVSFRSSYFLPAAKVLRDVYDSGGINYQLTGTIPVYKGPLEWPRSFAVWWGVDYFEKNGKSSLEKTISHIRIVPLTLGTKYLYAHGILRPYIGMGMKYWFVNIRNNSPYMIRHFNQNGMGGIVEGGFLIFLSKYLTLDFFSSYSFKEFGKPRSSLSYIETSSLEVGGWNFGGGIGFKW